MVINCTGKNMPRNQDKKHFELDFKSTVRFDVCKEDKFSGHTSILLDYNDFNFTDTGVILRTPFFNKCKCEARSACNDLPKWGSVILVFSLVPSNYGFYSSSTNLTISSEPVQKKQIAAIESQKWSSESEFNLRLIDNRNNDPYTVGRFTVQKLSDVSHKPVIDETKYPFEKYIKLIFPFRNV